MSDAQESIQHTPGPWYASTDYYGGPSVRTEPEPASNIDGRNSVFENTGRGGGSPTEEDVQLFALALTAPHQCSVLDCPGPKNLHRLELHDALMAALDLLLREAKVLASPVHHYSPPCLMCSDSEEDEGHTPDCAIAKAETLLAQAQPLDKS